MHPPLLKATTGRPKTKRYNGTGDKKRKSDKHLCPICKEYGHIGTIVKMVILMTLLQ
jgi:hypothetical protein